MPALYAGILISRYVLNQILGFLLIDKMQVVMIFAA